MQAIVLPFCRLLNDLWTATFGGGPEESKEMQRDSRFPGGDLKSGPHECKQ